MAEDLKLEISRIAYWKQIAAEHDPLGALPWHLPRVGASAEQLSEIERLIGMEFPKDYRQFLGLANGWKNFLVSTDLFGSQEFSKGAHLSAINRDDIRSYVSRLRVPIDDVLVIGASEEDIDVFLLFSERSPVLPTGVVWFASEEIDRFSSFSDFVSEIVNHNAGVAQSLISRSGAEH